jgi:hypothetical protein
LDAAGRKIRLDRRAQAIGVQRVREGVRLLAGIRDMLLRKRIGVTTGDAGIRIHIGRDRQGGTGADRHQRRGADRKRENSICKRHDLPLNEGLDRHYRKFAAKLVTDASSIAGGGNKLHHTSGPTQRMAGG